MVQIQGSCVVDVRKMPAVRKRPAPASDKPGKKAKVAPPEVAAHCSAGRPSLPHPHTLTHALQALPSTRARAIHTCNRLRMRAPRLRMCRRVAHSARRGSRRTTSGRAAVRNERERALRPHRAHRLGV